jgi:hypothetical protein
MYAGRKVELITKRATSLLPNGYPEFSVYFTLLVYIEMLPHGPDIAHTHQYGGQRLRHMKVLLKTGYELKS